MNFIVLFSSLLVLSLATAEHHHRHHHRHRRQHVHRRPVHKLLDPVYVREHMCENWRHFVDLCPLTRCDSGELELVTLFCDVGFDDEQVKGLCCPNYWRRVALEEKQKADRQEGILTEKKADDEKIEIGREEEEDQTVDMQESENKEEVELTTVEEVTMTTMTVEPTEEPVKEAPQPSVFTRFTNFFRNIFA